MKITFIGKIIKQLREERSLTIEQLFERSSVSIAKIVEIENGTVTPSIGVMIKISRALGARLGTLLDGQESMGAIVTRASTIIAETEHLTGGEMGVNKHMDFYPLAKGKKDRSMEPMIVEIEPTECNVESNSEHEGEEFIYVLSGAIEVRYGHQVHILEKGDSIYYDSIVPHSVGSATSDVARILAVIYTPY